jgi:hypothetical protein
MAVLRETLTQYRYITFNQCCGSGIRNPEFFLPWNRIRDPGSGIGFFSGSRIPTPYFLELSDKILGKKFNDSLKTGPNFLLLQHLKNKMIFNFVKFVSTSKGLSWLAAVAKVPNVNRQNYCNVL